MSFFTVDDLYQDTYRVERVKPFFEGELAVASAGGKRFFLQHAQLQKPAPPRAIQQYLSLKDHPLILPYLQVYSEERSLVFIRPYVDFSERLDQVISRGPIEEDQILHWVKSLFPVENVLKEKPLRMYTLLHPANIGVTEDGKLQVIFCGVEGRTLPEPVFDWGTLLYMMFTGRVLDEPLKKLPGDSPFPKQLGKFIHKSLNRPAGYVSSQLDSYIKKRDSKGLFDQLFKRSESSGKKDESEAHDAADGEEQSVSRERDHESQVRLDSILKERLEETRRTRMEKEGREDQEDPVEETEEEEAQDRRAKLEQKRQEAERRAQEEQERQAREEEERREQERLEAERRAQEEQERQAREEEERREQERLEAERREREEQERQAREEEERREQERLEAERREREEQERQACEEEERREQERLEAERREREEQERQAREEEERREQDQHERIAAQFEEYVQHVFNRPS
ncbi:hypothetical protein [Paludifilum halophilum]|uniref:Protein kinase domain-containing protein n=1 Tax=Paludifilum halophilum TaxID=1642702 RepID=A0A235B3X7_9BACL|nr:hypothetical protein [Paludifilum halophilum]OYD07026.1 hypothetical protein CHM34_13940 [Paludifilum halophilum]